MLRTCSTTLLVAALVGLAGCGGSKHSTSTVAQTAMTPTQSTPAQAVTTSAKPAAPKPKASQQKTATTAKPVTGTTGSTTPQASAKRGGGSASRAGAMIVNCLGRAGLLRPGPQRPGVWQGFDLATGQPVLVDGPYKTRAKANDSASTLVGVESAERGGMYVVSAALSAHLTAQVHKVAVCLNGTGSGRSQSF
jgi:hypothetical protein